MNPNRIVVGAFFALAFLTAIPAIAAPTQVERGHALVQRNCAVCHAVGTQGVSRNPEAPLFRELHTRYPVEMLAEALAEGILSGHPAMPEFVFTPPEIDDIIAYLRSIQTRGNAGVGAPARAVSRTRHLGA